MEPLFLRCALQDRSSEGNHELTQVVKHFITASLWEKEKVEKMSSKNNNQHYQQ